MHGLPLPRMSIARPGVAVLLWAVAAMPTQAALLQEPQWQAWHEAGQHAPLERAASARLAQDAAPAEQADALVALALVALDDPAPAQVEQGLVHAQRCVDLQPQRAACHYALGSLLATQALQGGMVKAAGLAGPIRQSLSRAVELDPLLYEARSTLQQFYLAAPGFIGGSVAKARELALTAQARQPEHAHLLRAQLAAHDKRWAEVESELSACKPGNHKALRDDLVEAWYHYGFHYLDDKRFAAARAVFERLLREHPGHALGAYGLGRLALDEAAYDQALARFEQARSLQGAAVLPIDHRLGQAWQAKGDKAQARLAYQRFIDQARAGRTSPRNLEDARKRLAELT